MRAFGGSAFDLIRHQLNGARGAGTAQSRKGASKSLPPGKIIRDVAELSGIVLVNEKQVH
jgi:hypothetical protein